MICTQSCLCQTSPLFLSLSLQLIRAVLLEWTTTSKYSILSASTICTFIINHWLMPPLAWLRISIGVRLTHLSNEAVCASVHHIYQHFSSGDLMKILANSEVNSSPFSAPIQWRLLHDTLPRLRCASDALKKVVWWFGRKYFWIDSDQIRWKGQTERERGGCTRMLHSHKDTCCIFCLQQNHNIISCCHLLSHYLFPHLNVITVFQSFIQVKYLLLTRSPPVPEKVTRSSTSLVLPEVAE